MILIAPPSPPLAKLIRRYVHCAIRADAALHRPIPARTAPSIEFTFGVPYRVYRYDRPSVETAYPVAIIGSQTYRRVQLELNGDVETFIVVFQPGGVDHLLSVPGAELTNLHFDAYSVIGRTMSPLADQLNEASSFKARICIANQFFEAHRSGSLPLHHLASVAREIFGKQGCVRISDLAAQTGLSLRQFERSFTQSIGLGPKIYARIARFEAAVRSRERSPKKSWAAIACDLGYYDQMHMVHDFRHLSGDSPTCTAALLHPFAEQSIGVESAREPITRV